MFKSIGITNYCITNEIRDTVVSPIIAICPPPPPVFQWILLKYYETYYVDVTPN